MFINQSDSEQLNKIRQAVTAQASIEKIIELCQIIAYQITDKQFSLTYAGILLAAQDRISDAIKILKLCPDRPFSAVGSPAYMVISIAYLNDWSVRVACRRHNGNYLNKQANSFSFIRAKFLNP